MWENILKTLSDPTLTKPNGPLRTCWCCWPHRSSFFSLHWRLSLSPQTSLTLPLPPKCANPPRAWASLPCRWRNTSTCPCTSYRYYRKGFQSHIPSPVLCLSINSAYGLALWRRSDLNWVWRLVRFKGVELGKEYYRWEDNHRQSAEMQNKECWDDREGLQGIFILFKKTFKGDFSTL